ncbi:peptide chain release factor N(5)-glutamine methyltransferase [Polynucleobacter alcilacus]|uniref:peptide chain release factor N(5)-glutamine methyltransferase n=1 Tax=Polynucleobacter alcilacus TaxID=1819739 RepID=UPI001C0C1DBB|nr:peptide chain release factor N(5)-glutamine methyltransferase [Polynucleobacter alcilacus]MBU3567987.1 peptide chain release factor N(5)-glutamine methyltransferase [Polynucleobacter alcilacus]
MSPDLSLRSLLGSSLLPSNEARLLMAYVLEKHYQLPRSALISKDSMALDPGALAEWQSLETKRSNGEPIAYLIGKRGFHNIELYVAPGVLIPRPETELLVEIGLHEITRLKQASDTQAKLLDLGTGSGAIALAIAYAAPQALITATDQSAEAIKIAKRNVKELGLEKRVELIQGSWYEPLDQQSFDIILSNPPYIAKQDPHLNQGDLRFEPTSALTDHATGLTCLESIISGAREHLHPNGFIAVEHGFDQSGAVMNLMIAAGLREVKAYLDLAGHHRVASGRK